MKELNIFEATALTSPNPLTLVCSEKEDGTTNLAPICFVSYLSFNPPMIGFATGKKAHTGERVRATGEVIITVPGESLSQAVMSCGSSTGSKTDKVSEYKIEMVEVAGSRIKIPADTKVAFHATLKDTVDVGDHYLHICNIKTILGDENKTGLFAWNGFGKAAPAEEKQQTRIFQNGNRQ